MAYDPTVWETYDVITKERLNKLEEGARTGTLLSGTDINVDLNMNRRCIISVDNIMFAWTMHVYGNDPLVFSGVTGTVIPSFQSPGEARILIHVSFHSLGHYNPASPRTITLYKNGSVIKTLSQAAIYSGDDHTYYPEVTLEAFSSYALSPNDVFTATTTHGTIIAIKFYGSIGVILPPPLIV